MVDQPICETIFCINIHIYYLSIYFNLIFTLNTVKSFSCVNGLYHSCGNICVTFVTNRRYVGITILISPAIIRNHAGLIVSCWLFKTHWHDVNTWNWSIITPAQRSCMGVSIDTLKLLRNKFEKKKT